MSYLTQHTTARRLHVRGIVQGVGFRPTVYNLARSRGLSGWVLNASDGVHMRIEGPADAVADFAQVLREHAPSAARIESIEEAEEAPVGLESFEIRMSDAGSPPSTLVSPDLATCDDCLRELFDPTDRRFRYPFINCTSCGPRFTIVDHLPYDRPATSMAAFEMCPDCSAEYGDPANRRFHAQPDACFACGPQLTFEEFGGEAPRFEGDARTCSDAMIARAAELLRTGNVLAVKGLGGFHLVCDATDDEAVHILRERKRRPKKPLAVMYPNLETVCAEFEVSGLEEQLLESPARPIVLLRRRPDKECALSAGVAFDLPEVGIMLPSTPVQHLLMAEMEGRPLVMTSGNTSGNPIVTDDAEARTKLSPIADAVLGNNRPILSRYDDSVVRVVDDHVQLVRRARGYAPQPVALPFAPGAPALLACGPEQKATFALARGDEAFISQHIGDLESAEAFESWEATLALYQRLFGIEPAAIACDMHPEYLSSKWARAAAKERRLPLVEVQHHHAHIAAVTGEHGVSDPVLGIALDGTGFGDDGTIWGGELLVCDWEGYRRAGRLKPLPMPGGAAAIQHPLRMAAGALHACGLADSPNAAYLRKQLGENAWNTLAAMVFRGINCPQTSSAGRLLDAASALLGVCTEATYDGEPAIALEAAAIRCAAAPSPYPFDLHEGGLAEIDPAPALAALLADIAAGAGVESIARNFIDGLSRAFADAAVSIARSEGLSTVALGGGVFMNRIILGTLETRLSAAGLAVLIPNQLPANDGAIAYGQAVVARARLSQQKG